MGQDDLWFYTIALNFLLLHLTHLISLSDLWWLPPPKPHPHHWGQESLPRKKVVWLWPQNLTTEFSDFGCNRIHQKWCVLAQYPKTDLVGLGGALNLHIPSHYVINSLTGGLRNTFWETLFSPHWRTWSSLVTFAFGKFLRYKNLPLAMWTIWIYRLSPNYLLREYAKHCGR